MLNHTEQPFSLSSQKMTGQRKTFQREPFFSKAERQDIGKAICNRANELIRSGYPARREAGYAMLQEAERFCLCGSQYSMFDCPVDRQRFRSPVSCNSRICERCGRRYFRSYQESISHEIAPLFSQPRRGWGVFLLTLTTTTKRYNGLPTREDISRFYRETGDFFRLTYGKHFAKITAKGKIIEDGTRTQWTRDSSGNRIKIRRQPRIRKNKSGKEVQDWRRFKGCGYITTVELGTQKTKDGLNNNLHCHALVYGPYISQRELVARWFKITGDSFVVDIRKVRTPREATAYVLKYITKPPAIRDPEAIADYVEMIKGTRRLRSGGVFFDRIRKKVIEKMKHCCPWCGGRLEQAGTQSIMDLDAHDSLPLYQLLRQGIKAPPGQSARQVSSVIERQIYQNVLGLSDSITQ